MGFFADAGLTDHWERSSSLNEDCYRVLEIVSLRRCISRFPDNQLDDEFINEQTNETKNNNEKKLNSRRAKQQVIFFSLAMIVATNQYL